MYKGGVFPLLYMEEVMNPIENLQQKINQAKKQGYKEIKISVDFLDQIVLFFIDNIIKTENKKEDIIIVKTGGSFKK